MLRYEGAECPYCHQTLHDSDEITVCPQCGVPYHRECAKKAGGCVLTELHAQGRQWQKVSRPGERTIDGYAQLRCSRCGTLNQPGAKVCEICGTPLDNQQPDQNNAGETPPPQDDRQQQWNQPSWQQQGAPGMPPFQMPFDPFVNPMGGLDPEETDRRRPGKRGRGLRQTEYPLFPAEIQGFSGKRRKWQKTGVQLELGQPFCWIPIICFTAKCTDWAQL